MRQLLELKAAIRQASLGTSVLAAHIADLRSLLETDLAVSYGIFDAGDHLELDFMHTAGTRDPDAARRKFAAWLRGVGTKTRWAAYNPMLPQDAQRNRVFPARRRRGPRFTTKVASELYPVLGLHEHDCARALICDGPRLLAWVGVYQSEAIASWQRTALRALIEPLTQRLSAERQLARYAAMSKALEVSLEALPCAAFMLAERGEVEAGNTLARAALRDERERTLGALRTAVKNGGPDAEYAVRSLENVGEQRWYLALARASIAAASPRERAATAQARFGLSERQTDVLALLLEGHDGPAIERTLCIERSTREKHEAALRAKVGVRRRGALLVRISTL
jgi:DNA-binding CsgD family transcriptional regulator